MPVETEAPKKEYSPPVLATRTREQATLFLVGHAWIGDPGARSSGAIFFRNLIQNNA
jgi:hypothetical protein